MADVEYYVLEDANIDTIVEMTGKKKEDLIKHLKDGEMYGHRIVLWKEFNTWFAIRVDDKFIQDGYLNDIIQTILRRPH